jgi:hypothetical protein
LREGHFEAAVVKNTTFLRTLYGQVVTPSELATRVDEHAAWAQEQLGRHESALAATDEPLRRLVLQWAIDARTPSSPPPDAAARHSAGAGDPPR